MVLHEALKDPRKDKDTRLVGEFFTGTAIDLMKLREH